MTSSVLLAPQEGDPYEEATVRVATSNIGWSSYYYCSYCSCYYYS